MGTNGKRRVKRSPRANGAPLLYASVFLVFSALAISVLAVKAGESAKDRPASVVTVPGASAAPAVPASQAEGLRPEAPAGASSAKTAAPPGGEDPAPVIAPKPGTEKPRPEARKSRGTIVFIVDDVGYNTWQLEPFLAIPGPITFAVLPHVPYTVKATGMIKAAGKELILHQPMEAINKLDAGPGVITTAMDDMEIRRVLRDNLAQVPGAVGVNNHMGSKATADVRVMSIVLEETASSGLYFIDSLTIGDSVVHSVASLMRLPAWERTVFLDNTPDKASILHYVDEGKKIAEKRGYAIMIGHVWSAELAQTLTDLYPTLVEQGFSLSTIARIMMAEGDDADLGD